MSNKFPSDAAGQGTTVLRTTVLHLEWERRAWGKGFFYSCKGLWKNKSRIYDRNQMWLTEPRIFAVWRRFADPWLRVGIWVLAAECASCSNAHCFYWCSKVERNARNTDIDFHSFTTCIPLIKAQHSIMNRSVFCMYWRLLTLFYFWASNTVHHTQFRVHSEKSHWR